MGRPVRRERGLAELDVCHLTTTGRRSGDPHTIEIWFALRDGVVYLLAGGGEASDWVRNIRADPDVGLRIADVDLHGRAHVVEDVDEDELARGLVLAKYGRRDTGDLTEWGRTALPVSIVLDEDDAAP